MMVVVMMTTVGLKWLSTVCCKHLTCRCNEPMKHCRNNGRGIITRHRGSNRDQLAVSIALIAAAVFFVTKFALFSPPFSRQITIVVTITFFTLCCCTHIISASHNIRVAACLRRFAFFIFLSHSERELFWHRPRWPRVIHRKSFVLLFWSIVIIPKE